jgi:RNA recognition motif-containing protein
MAVSLFIGNLPFSTSEQELADLFARAGTVERVRIPTDRETGRVRGFGFVEMASLDEAQEAIRQFDGYQLSGRELRVSVAEDRRR